MSMIHINNPYTKSNATNIQDGDVQPNAIDLRVDKILKINSDLFEISNESKKHRSSTKIELDSEGYFNLDIGEYEVVMSNMITIGENEAGWLVTRSTLTRNGCIIVSGLYDSGFSGFAAGTLHIKSGPVRIKHDTRLAQFILVESKSIGMYNGDYGLNRDGEPKQMERKYVDA